jgi:enterochelin esterase family protein
MLIGLNLLAATHTSALAQMKDFNEAYRVISRGHLSSEQASAFTTWYGQDHLIKGDNPRSEDLRFVFAISISGEAKEVKAESEDGKWSVKLKPLGESLYGAAAKLPEGVGFRWHYSVDATKVGGGQLEAYTYPPETKAQPNVPHGTLTQQPDWKSKIFEGTNRHWWIYVPAQYDPNKAACLFLIQDGQWTRGYWPTVLDNMIAAKQIPVSIAVFVTPGTIQKDLDNRSIEYDTVSDRYPNMLADEILPEVYKRYNVRRDPAAHLIAGLSSSGISSFNAAWFRPDVFGKVVSWIGSFTNLQGGPTGSAGGNTYPAMIRALRGWDKKGEPKPIRVFLQDGLNDLDNKAGNWPLSNQQMAKALEYGGYDYKFVLGNGFHSDMNGRAVLPDTLRWMWRDEAK